ncbi:unnamed protein product [Nippostrongylus brasiliensis]|uniref:Secreted protein n=1 Tax=Nippostrongylus brasiliensis TaxID=27835 RepID=A0A0N4YX54_NIPBR|nr:unnamed protein product [Nippostrongylus brasiliensis]
MMMAVMVVTMMMMMLGKFAWRLLWCTSRGNLSSCRLMRRKRMNACESGAGDSGYSGGPVQSEGRLFKEKVKDFGIHQSPRGTPPHSCSVRNRRGMENTYSAYTKTCGVSHYTRSLPLSSLTSLVSIYPILKGFSTRVKQFVRHRWVI